MTDLATQIAPLPHTPPTLAEIKDKLEQLFDLAPAGGNFLWFSLSYREASISTTHNANGSWRIQAIVTIPVVPSFFYAKLAHWGVESATKDISFVLNVADVEDTADDGTDTTIVKRQYIILNGEYPNSPFSRKEPIPRNFRDAYLSATFGQVYYSDDFDDVIKVLRSELTGEMAFDG